MSNDNIKAIASAIIDLIDKQKLASILPDETIEQEAQQRGLTIKEDANSMATALTVMLATGTADLDDGTAAAMLKLFDDELLWDAISPDYREGLIEEGLVDLALENLKPYQIDEVLAHVSSHKLLAELSTRL